MYSVRKQTPYWAVRNNHAEYNVINGIQTKIEAKWLCDLLNDYQDTLEPIEKVCSKYGIKVKDLPDVLEEYIAYDNAEYLEKLKNQ